MPAGITLISHHLCPYVPRAAISLHENDVMYERKDIDLANKPDWFSQVSPLGTTAVLLAGDVPVFEASAIPEFLEDTQDAPVRPRDALDRARHRGWIEFGSSILNDIAGLCSAKTAPALAEKAAQLRTRFTRLESKIGSGPFFGGAPFSLVDASCAPICRYFDRLGSIADFGILTGLPAMWRRALAARPAVKAAVRPDHHLRLKASLLARGSHISTLMTAPVRD